MTPSSSLPLTLKNFPRGTVTEFGPKREIAFRYIGETNPVGISI